MYNSSRRQFIFKQSSGKIINMYYDERQGLIYSTLTKRNTWSEPVSLQKNIYPSFHAEMDSDDNIHVLFQDKQGNIFYSNLLSSGSVKNVPVLNSKTPAQYNKYLNLAVLNGTVHFFYVLQHKDSLLLAHQILNENAVNTPKVIDYVFKGSCPYSMLYDGSGNIYIFYQASDGKYLQIGYKKFIPSQKQWSDFMPVSRFNGDSELPRTLIDNNSIMHISYQRLSSRQYELVYQQKVPDKNLWTGEAVVHTSAHPFEEASIVSSNGSLIIYWVREDIIFYTTSADNGKTWSKPTRLNFNSGRQLMCISYKSNNPYEKEKLALKDIPGNFINGIKLAFYQDLSEAGSNVSPEELKNMILDSLKMLKGSMEEIKDQCSRLDNEIKNLQNKQETLEREFVKHTLKLDMVVSDASHAKNMDNRLESLKNELAEYKSKSGMDEFDIDEIKAYLTDEVLKNGLLQKWSSDLQTVKAKIDEIKKNAPAKSYKHKKKQ